MRKNKTIVNVFEMDFIKVDYLKATSDALDKMKEILTQKGDAGGLLVTLSQKGCAGFAYKLEYARPNVNLFPNFELAVIDGINIFINPKISLYIIGTEVNFVNEKTHSGFVFQNPNEKGKCGCGESFFVDNAKVH